MEAKPLRVVPSSDDRAGEGGGPQKKIDRGRSRTMEDFEEKRGLVVKEEYSAIKLGLGVGAYSAAINPVVAREKPLFTEAQRRELEHQTFIFKHFALNVPVPQYLVLPILESLAGTSESGFGVRWFSPQGFGYGNMDPEPHRCRRTDGKKWRCREKVVPDQKYCERHMHRGCNRSRKPVETSEVNSSFLTKPSGKLHPKLSSNTKSAVPVLVPNPLGTQLIDTSIFTTSSSPCTIETFSTNRCKSSISSAGTRASISPASVVYASSTCATVAVPKVTTISSMTSIAANNKSYLNFCKKDDISKSCISHSNIGVRSSGIGSIINDSNISTRIGFSPTSVLQAITVSSGHHSGIIDRNNTELEPGRCRRTDGKKWRCRSSVLPDQKYCATHMHRGAKKRFADHEPSANPLTSAVTIARLPPTAAKPNIHKAYYTVPNINLSMSIPACAPLTQCKEENPSSSSDTDTTISDTMNDYSHASFPETVSKLAPV